MRIHRRSHINIIETRHLTKVFPGDVGVRRLDLTVSKGQMVGLIGPSGSGKTTTVRLLTGLLEPDVGEVTVLGERPASFSPNTRDRIGYLPQESVMYPNLSIWENLDFAAALYGVPRATRRQRSHDLLTELDLIDAADRRLADASGGMRRRLGLAVALIHDPELVFLDEPTAGLDPVLRRSLWDRIHEMRSDGKTFIMTTQYVGEATHCDEIVLLMEGSIAAKGEPSALRRLAYGGELLDVVFAVPPTRSVIQTLAEAVQAEGVEHLDARTIRFVVADAASAGPEVADVAKALDVEIDESKATIPEFDDVFLRIVQSREMVAS